MLAFTTLHEILINWYKVQLGIRAVFSKYSITPARALNFGPVTFNTAALPRILEVTNIGEVPFNLRLFDPIKGLQVRG